MNSRVLAALILLVSSAAAQLDKELVGSTAAQLNNESFMRKMRVQVTFANRVCALSSHVGLSGSRGLVAEANVNEKCEAEFANIPVGTYHLAVSGQGFLPSDEIVQVSMGSTDFEVKIKRQNDPAPSGAGSSNAFVSVADLAIPSKALKKFNQANDLIARADYDEAIKHLNDAIAIYPAYAGAYNNLGTVYARLGDREKESDSLQKAISIDDHFAPAYVNLARMNIAKNDFAGAESALIKASAYDPTDAMTLVLLTYSAFMNGHFDLTIATSHTAHGLQGEHAFAHQVAARAYEQKRDAAKAITELELFLKEEPSGQRAEIARHEMAQLKAIQDNRTR